MARPHHSGLSPAEAALDIFLNLTEKQKASLRESFRKPHSAHLLAYAGLRPETFLDRVVDAARGGELSWDEDKDSSDWSKVKAWIESEAKKTLRRAVALKVLENLDSEQAKDLAGYAMEKPIKKLLIYLDWPEERALESSFEQICGGHFLWKFDLDPSDKVHVREWLVAALRETVTWEVGIKVFSEERIPYLLKKARGWNLYGMLRPSGWTLEEAFSEAWAAVQEGRRKWSLDKDPENEEHIEKWLRGTLRSIIGHEADKHSVSVGLSQYMLTTNMFVKQPSFPPHFVEIEKEVCGSLNFIFLSDGLSFRAFFTTGSGKNRKIFGTEGFPSFESARSAATNFAEIFEAVEFSFGGKKPRFSFFGTDPRCAEEVEEEREDFGALDEDNPEDVHEHEDLEGFELQSESVLENADFEELSESENEERSSEDADFEELREAEDEENRDEYIEIDEDLNGNFYWSRQPPEIVFLMKERKTIEMQAKKELIQKLTKKFKKDIDRRIVFMIFDGVDFDKIANALNVKYQNVDENYVKRRFREYDKYLQETIIKRKSILY